MTDELKMTPRGFGLNHLPCGWCNYVPILGVQADLASFVKDEATGDAIVTLFAQAGLLASVDKRRAEGRFQVKVGACGIHEPNLRLLSYLCSAYYTRNGISYRDPITIELLMQTVPGIQKGGAREAVNWVTKELAEHPLETRPGMETYRAQAILKNASECGGVTMSDVELRALAEAATPGPWRAEPNTGAGRVWVQLGPSNWQGDLEPIFKVRSHQNGSVAEYEQREHDAAYIAACSPDVVLELLDRVERAETAWDAMQDGRYAVIASEVKP